ncbi:glucan 1,4-alpha-glucosidase [uncultured archaeon]|nr:glucan 1,4-alpha-glucosidase [uncultured archaeon]
MARAFGKPGIEPKWTHGNKDGIGTAYHSSSQIWFTIWNGILTEIYYPTVDKPQVRDLQYLISDGKGLFHEEKVDLVHRIEKIHMDGLAYRITNTDPDGRYEIRKEIISDPHSSVILQHTSIDGKEDFLRRMSLYVLCAPHLDVGGWSNNGSTVRINGRDVLLAEKNGTYLAISASVPFKKVSCGYVGQSDGWTDISQNHRMTYEFNSSEDGNIALTGEIDLSASREFVLGASLGDSMHSAVTRLFQALSMDFKESRKRYFQQWERGLSRVVPLEELSSDGGKLYRSSYSILLAHEDKTYEGSVIASLSIPWGEVAGDNDRGGYHLVWTRDLYNSATAALAAGNRELPLRALIYLSVSQLDDGGFAQNFWIDGTPYWHGVQLDEAAFPIILAWKLRSENALRTFDPYTMVLEAAAFIVKNGPATQQERWEEASGYSPSTIASNIAALVCAASFARDGGDQATATYLEEYADFLECHIESWTVTTQGTLVPGIPRHFIRIRPASVPDGVPDEDPNTGTLHINNISPEETSDFSSKDIVDGGFLEFVRYGIRKADDTVILDSIKVIDNILKVDTPYGPVWHRYNHDGYGQRDDGSAYQGWGRGRAWPLLTGERGHYEISAGNSPDSFIKAMENFASHTMMIPEQVWDKPDFTERHLHLGRATGSARPLVWAHAEYIKLLRSAREGKPYDRIDIVENRYITDRSACRKFEVWKHNRRIGKIGEGLTLRIQADRPFTLHWSNDSWKTQNDSDSNATGLSVYYTDIQPADLEAGSVKFTFRWSDDGSWEGHDHEILVNKD